MLTTSLAPHCLLFLLATPHLLPTFYLLGEPAILLVARIPIYSCPWFAINCSPLATSPALTHPIDQVTISTQTTSTTSAVLSDTMIKKVKQFDLKVLLRIFNKKLSQSFRRGSVVKVQIKSILSSSHWGQHTESVGFLSFSLIKHTEMKLLIVKHSAKQNSQDNSPHRAFCSKIFVLNVFLTVFSLKREGLVRPIRGQLRVNQFTLYTLYTLG